jgi:predicted RNase H-like HicB family nuclease
MLALRAIWLQGKTPDEAMAIGKAAGMTGLATDVMSLIEASPGSATAAKK